MALKKTNLVSENGLTIPNAYIRIDSFEGSKYSVRLHISTYNIVQEDVKVITPTEEEIEVELEDGTKETQTITTNVETTEQVDVLKKIEETTFDITPNLQDEDNILAQGYVEIKSTLFPDSEDC